MTQTLRKRNATPGKPIDFANSVCLLESDRRLSELAIYSLKSKGGIPSRKQSPAAKPNKEQMDAANATRDLLLGYAQLPGFRFGRTNDLGV